MGGYWQHLQAVSRLSMTAGLIFASSPAVLACGYHDDVSMARGMMNWVYPEALHVLGAISTAVAERRLAPPLSDKAPDLFGSRYRRTAEALERFGEALGESADRMPALSFSIVLLEPMLWTRYEAAGGRLRTQVHVTGPKAGDLVLVSGEAVIGGIVAGRLATGEAIERGLIRLYGSESQKAVFVGAFRSAGNARPDTIKPAAMSRAAQSVAGGETAMPLRSVPITALSIRQSTAFGADGTLACGPGHH
ncbi:hypothetical protein I6F07_06395 [Ensifer sp. IC4062]|nr:hypothetical protein [Ensifer sp. IC4062]MCA1439861.1 hypothetical protein [Ensifer sp. IC4062]